MCKKGEFIMQNFKSLDNFQSLTKKSMQKVSGGSQADYNFFFGVGRGVRKGIRWLGKQHLVLA